MTSLRPYPKGGRPGVWGLDTDLGEDENDSAQESLHPQPAGGRGLGLRAQFRSALRSVLGSAPRAATAPLSYVTGSLHLQMSLPSLLPHHIADILSRKQKGSGMRGSSCCSSSPSPRSCGGRICKGPSACPPAQASPAPHHRRCPRCRHWHLGSTYFDPPGGSGPLNYVEQLQRLFPACDRRVRTSVASGPRRPGRETKLGRGQTCKHGAQAASRRQTVSA